MKKNGTKNCTDEGKWNKTSYGDHKGKKGGHKNKKNETRLAYGEDASFVGENGHGPLAAPQSQSAEGESQTSTSTPTAAATESDSENESSSSSNSAYSVDSATSN